MHCYAQLEKSKSQQVLEAFAAGSGAKMAWTTRRELLPGPAVFYGVRPAWKHLWEQAKREGRDWFFIDNAYFDCCRERYFRVTKNAIQHTGRGVSDGKRFSALGIPIRPMRAGRDYDLVCRQSDEFMRVVANDPHWCIRVITQLRAAGRYVVVRSKNEKRPLADDLRGACRLWTWSSAAAVTALLEGVPVTCSTQCCAHEVTDRAQWAAVLADNQFTLEELASNALV